MSCKKLLLVRFGILQLFVNTTTTDDKIVPCDRCNFARQIQTQLAEEPKKFSAYFFAFLKPTSCFEYFVKDEGSHSLSISRIINSERGGYLNV